MTQTIFIDAENKGDPDPSKHCVGADVSLDETIARDLPLLMSRITERLHDIYELAPNAKIVRFSVVTEK